MMLKPVAVFQSEGVRGDILRSIVVFLHATFEELIRSHSPRAKERFCFYLGSDLDKVLLRSGFDPQRFKSLYPPLTAMAKRRNEIVHHADLPNAADDGSIVWGAADDWQLIMWLLAGVWVYRSEERR